MMNSRMALRSRERETPMALTFDGEGQVEDGTFGAAAGGSGVTVAGTTQRGTLDTLVSRAMARLHETQHPRIDVTVDTYVGRDVVVCTFRAQGGAAGEQTPLADRIGFPAGRGHELVAAVEGLTARRVVAFLNADESDPGVAGQLFFLEPEGEPGPTRFEVSTEPLGGGAIVRVEGDLDLGSVREVEKEAREQIESRGGRLVLDLSRAPFIDASAINLLHALDARAAKAGGGLIVVLACPKARWLLDIVPARRELRVVGSVAEAMAAGPVPGLAKAG